LEERSKVRLHGNINGPSDNLPGGIVGRRAGKADTSSTGCGPVREWFAGQCAAEHGVTGYDTVHIVANGKF
jgi:hypothetical protein